MALVYPNGTVTVTIPATESIAVYTSGKAQVYRNVGYPQVPSTTSLLGEVEAEQTVFGAYASGASITIEAGAAEVYYEVGVAPVVKAIYGQRYQPDPVALNATGAVTAAAIMGGIVTSSTAAAVAGTIPTGAVMDLAAEWAVGDAVDWSVINTGPNTFTVTAASGHTIVGTATVATTVSGRFRTRKTAADTFITYRLA
jgi:hypothetical protein